MLQLCKVYLITYIKDIYSYNNANPSREKSNKKENKETSECAVCCKYNLTMLSITTLRISYIYYV